MKVFIVHAHPEPTSFNGALKDAAVEQFERLGHEVKVTDLYAEGFNPVAGRHDFTTVLDPDRFHYQREQAHAADNDGFSPELARDQERLFWCDLLILQFPLWWTGMPAILKGWVDRVLAFGVAYGEGLRFDRGLLKGRQGLLCITTGGTTERFSEGGVYGPIDVLIKPVQRGVLQYMGMEALPPFVAYAAPRVSDEERKAYLRTWSEYLAGISQEVPA